MILILSEEKENAYLAFVQRFLSHRAEIQDEMEQQRPSDSFTHPTNKNWLMCETQGTGAVVGVINRVTPHHLYT